MICFEFSIVVVIIGLIDVVELDNAVLLPSEDSLCSPTVASDPTIENPCSVPFRISIGCFLSGENGRFEVDEELSEDEDIEEDSYEELKYEELSFLLSLPRYRIHSFRLS